MAERWRRGEQFDPEKEKVRIGFHRGLRCDGGPGCLLKRVGDPPSL